MAKRDERYARVKRMIDYGEIKEIKDILEFIPKTVIAIDLNKKPNRIQTLMNKPEEFKFGEIFTIASFCQIDPDKLVSLIKNEYLNKKGQV